MAENNQIPQGVLERISSIADLPYFVLEINLGKKNKKNQRDIINQIEHEISFNTEYDVSSEFSDSNHGKSVYHLHFRRTKPNA
jgi:hypothetical protein